MPETETEPDANGSAPQTVEPSDPDNELPLTVGHIRRAIEAYDDETQVFIECHDYSDRPLVWILEGQQIPWSNPDWRPGDELVVGLELQVGRYPDEPLRERMPTAREALEAAADGIARIRSTPGTTGPYASHFESWLILLGDGPVSAPEATDPAVESGS